MSQFVRHQVSEVFTPSTPARQTFVERAEVNDQVVDALRTPGKQLIVYGHSGSGKTTLVVNKLCQIYEHHIVSHCSVTSTFESVLLDAFDQLSPYYLSQASSKQQDQLTSGIAAEVSSIKVQLTSVTTSESQVSLQRGLPLQLSPANLGRFLGVARTAWILDDFHKVEDAERLKLAQAMKVFVDLGGEFPDLKIVAIGAVDTPRAVLDCEPKMKRRLAEIRVPLMTRLELESIIFKGETLLNVSIPYSLKAAISHYSSGLAAVCHQLCLNLCRVAGVEVTAEQLVEIGPSQLRAALERYVQDGSDTLKAVFQRAIRNKRKSRFNNCQVILRALSQCPEDGARHHELLARIRSGAPAVPSGNLTQYLRELQTPDRGEVVRFDNTDLRYSFADPLFRVYSTAALSGSINHSTILTHVEIRRILEALEEAIVALEPPKAFYEGAAVK